MKAIRKSVDAGRNERKFPAFLTDHRITNLLVIRRPSSCRRPRKTAKARRSLLTALLSSVGGIAAPAALGSAAR